jgi:hypothetical protein
LRGLEVNPQLMRSEIKKEKEKMNIKNKTLVNNMKNILLKELEEQFKHNNSSLEMLFKQSIKNAINKTAHDVNFDIINKGAFVGYGNKKRA